MIFGLRVDFECTTNGVRNIVFELAVTKYFYGLKFLSYVRPINLT